MGWKSNPNHPKGLTQIVHAPGYNAAPLPSAATVRDRFYLTDQGDRGACVAFTGVECLDAQWTKQHGEFARPSFLDVYQQCLKLDGSWPQDAGSYTSTVLKVLTLSGACLEKQFQYSSGFTAAPPQCAVKARSGYKVITAYDVPNDDKGAAIRQCIANLHVPVLTGGYWYDNGFTPKIDPATGRHYIPMPKGKVAGGHEVSIVSYDDNFQVPGAKNKGAVEFHNHWGNWASSGFCWAPYDYFLNKTKFEDNGVITLTK